MIRRRRITAPLGIAIAAATVTFPVEIRAKRQSPPLPSVVMTFESGIAATQLVSFTDGKRFTLTEDGFARVEGNERVVTHPGVDAGSLFQPAATYDGALPLDDVDAPRGSGDLLHFTKTVSGDVVELPGDHSAPDIYGGTGRGAVFTQSASGTGRFRAVNGKLTGVVAGDVIRQHSFVRVSDVAASGTIALRQYGQAVALNLTHDASGAITGTNANWLTTRADVSPFPVTLGGQQFYYVWWDRIATGTADIDFGVDFVDTIEGRKIHLQSFHWQKNPADAPAAVPVTLPGNYGGDAISTGIETQVGFILHGADSARSIAPGGVISPPSINRGLGYLPIVTRVDVVNTPLELVDRGGIMPNENHLFYGRPWQTPDTLNLFYGPGWFSRRYYQALVVAENAGTINFRSVFQSRRDLYAKFGQIATSSARLNNLSFDRVIALPDGETVDEYWQQTSIRVGTGSSYRLFANNDVSFTNSLFLGMPLDATRARYAIQNDETDDKRVYYGDLTLETQAGGTLSLLNSRTHKCPRTATFALSQTTPINLITTNFGATMFWMDMLYVARGTYNTWAGDDMFGGLTPAYDDLFFAQSERPVRISADSGETWADLDPAFDVKTMPHGFLGEHIGTYNFDTNTFTSAPDATKTLPVRYWYPGGGLVNKPGFQWHASQMDMGTHKRWPDSGDVFRIKDGSTWIDVTYQAGRYTSTSVYNRTITGGHPAAPSSAVSNDFIQINRTDVTMTDAVTLDGAVWIGPKGGYFLTGSPADPTPSNGSRVSNITVQNTIGMHNGTNAYRFDWSAEPDSVALVRDALFIEARNDTTFIDGQGTTLSIGAAGPNNTLTLDNVTVISSANSGGLAGAEGGAVYVNPEEVRTILAGRRSAFDTFAAPDPKVPQYFNSDIYDTVQGRPRLPTYDQLWTFQFTEFAETDTGLPLNATLDAARVPQMVWNPIIETLEGKFGQAPAATVMVYADTAVGATLATGLTGSGFDLYDGGNHEGFFTLTDGTLTLAKSMAGVDHVFPLLTAAGQRVIVDKVLTNTPIVNAAPVFTASSISGTAEDGEVLTANATVTGTPTPTLSYQWQNNGTNISGETASTITLDADAMSLTNGDTISCEITATNSEGTATAEPTIVFSEVTTLSQLLALQNTAGGANSTHDFTGATDPGTWTSADLSANGNNFTQPTTARKPGISGTLGATFDGADFVAQTVAGGTLTVILSLTKDDASTSGAVITDQAETTAIVQYLSGNTFNNAATITVNGASAVTRGDLYTALHATGERILKAVIDATGDTELRLGRSSGALLGSIRRAVVLEHGTLGGDLAAAVALAETWVVAS
jgi:hypothetical protein